MKCHSNKVILTLVLLLSIIFLGGCSLYGPAPGKGEKAEYYYLKAKPIINALELFFDEHHEYPKSLDELKPKYLKTIDWPTNMYRRAGDGYELWFSYQGPGINTCVYMPGKEWDCSGLI